MFRRLSVFAASFTFEGAEAVADAGDLGDTWILDVVDGLVTKSLLSVDSATYGTRYRYLRDDTRLRPSAARRGQRGRGRARAS